MSDRRLRERERALGLEGSPEEQAELLRALLRRGEVAPEAVRDAAYAGDLAACLAIGEGLVSELPVAGQPTCARLALGGRVVVVTGSAGLHLHDLEGNTPARQLAEWPMWPLTIGPEGGTALAGQGWRVTLWDVSRGAYLGERDLVFDAHYVFDVASRNGRDAIVATDRGLFCVEVLEVGYPETYGKTLLRKGRFCSAALSAARIAGGQRGKVEVWRLGDLAG